MRKDPRLIATLACCIVSGCGNSACLNDREANEGAYLAGRSEGYGEGYQHGMERVCESIKNDLPKTHETLLVRGICKSPSRWQGED